MMYNRTKRSCRFMKIGELIRSKRKEKGMTLRQLADNVGISQPYLSQIESGKRKPTQELIQKFSNELAIEEKQLLNLAGYHTDNSDLIDLVQEFQNLNNKFQEYIALHKFYLQQVKSEREAIKGELSLLEGIMRELPQEQQTIFESEMPIQEKLTILKGNVKALEKAQQLEESIELRKVNSKNALQTSKNLDKQLHIIQSKMLELQEAIQSEVNQIAENNTKILEK